MLMVPADQTAFSAVDLVPELAALAAARHSSWPSQQGVEQQGEASLAEEDAAALRRRLESEFLAAEQAAQQPADLEAGTARCR